MGRLVGALWEVEHVEDVEDVRGRCLSSGLAREVPTR
jgi:hypothetical protein